MNTPKISIIVPIYKAEKYLCKCIDSILAQTFTDFELLLIDDGSPDNSGKICDEYAEEDSRIRVFHKENGGVSSARNMGLDNARGEWIYFSDADDVIKTDGLQLLLDGVKDGVKFVMAGYEIYDETETLIYGCKKSTDRIVTSYDCLLYMFKPIDYPYHGYLWCKLFYARIIKKRLLRFDEKISFNEDRLFIVQYLCSESMECFYTTVPIYNYYIRQSSTMASISQRFNYKFVSDLDAFVLMLESIQKTNSRKIMYWGRRGLYFSYIHIKSMMKKFKVKDKILNSKINEIINENIPWIYQIHFSTIRIANRIKYKLNEML